MFWRYQTGLSDQFLATIEAIYYFFVEWHRAQHGAGASDAAYSYDGCYDNLLLLFRYQYCVIQRAYHRSGKAFTTKQRAGYIEEARPSKPAGAATDGAE